MGSFENGAKTVVIAEANGCKIEAPLASGEPQTFFAAFRSFDEQLYFMNLIKTKACDDKIIDESVDAILAEIRPKGDESLSIMKVGVALYGASWVSSMANDLGVDERSVRRWKAGTHAVPTGVWTEIQAIVFLKNRDLQKIEEELF